MKLKKTFFPILFSIVMAAILIPNFAHATSCGGVNTILISCGEDDGSGSSIMNIASIAINVFTIILGVLAAIGIGIFGLQYLTAKDNPTQVIKAKRRLFEIVIGLGVYASIYALLFFLLPGFSGSPSNSLDSDTPTSDITTNPSNTEVQTIESPTTTVTLPTYYSATPSAESSVSNATDDTSTVTDNTTTTSDTPTAAPALPTVTFNSNGGSTVSTQSIQPGATATQPTSPTRSGYTFRGWYTNNRAEYDFSQPVEADITLHAIWAPLISYSANQSGKFIYVNNPEDIKTSELLANNGKSLYNDSFNGTAEIHWAHTVYKNSTGSSQLYYGIRLWNPSSTAVTVTVNSCGSQKGGWGNGLITAEQYHTNSCNIQTATGESLLGRSFIIPARTSIFIYQTSDQIRDTSGSAIATTFVVEQEPRASDTIITSERNQVYVDGTLKLTSTGNLHVDNLIFSEKNWRVVSTTYSGNYTNDGGIRVYSGYYNKLPDLDNNATYDIYDETPSGTLPISYQSNQSGIIANRDSWTTNSTGSTGFQSDCTLGVDTEAFVSDYLPLNVKISGTNTATMGPFNHSSDPRHTTNWVNAFTSCVAARGGDVYGANWNYASWNVHHHDNIVVNNHSSSAKTVSIHTVADGGKSIAMVCGGQFTYSTGDSRGNEISCPVTVPAGESRSIPATITLAGNSNGGVTKWLTLDN